MSAENSQNLIPLETITAVSIFATENGVDNIIAQVKEKAVIGEFDISKEDDRDRIRSMAFKVTRTKTALEDMGKDFVAEEKAKIKIIDTRRIALWSAMEEIQTDVRRPLTEFEDKEKARLAGHNEGMESVRSLLTFNNEPGIADVEERIKELETLKARDFQEFGPQAKTVIETVENRLSEKLAQVIKADEDAKELERLRAEKAERDEQARIDKIKADAETAAAAKAIKDAQDQINAANQRAAEAEKKLEEKTADPPAPPPVQEQPKAAPETIRTAVGGIAMAEKERRRKINAAVKEAIAMEGMTTDKEAEEITKAIIMGRIPNVTITY